MRRVRFELLCRSLYRDQYAESDCSSLFLLIPCWESQRLIPKRSAGPRATKIGVVSLTALDHHRPNRESPRGEFLFATPQPRHQLPDALRPSGALDAARSAAQEFTRVAGGLHHQYVRIGFPTGTTHRCGIIWRAA